MNIQAPRGTKDILPAEMGAWHRAEEVFGEVCTAYGFEEIRVPSFEATELFTRGVGNSTDIVRKEMYTFEDKSGRSLSLRPEGTAGVVRAYIENGMASLPTPLKLYYDLNMFRYEKMQKGRYREFSQFGAELFGSQSPLADVEIISMLATFFEKLGLKEITLQIGSIGCPNCRSTYTELLKAYYEPLLPQLCDDCKERFAKNPLRLLDCKEEKCQKFIAAAPKQIDHLCESCQTHFDTVCAGLEKLNIPFEINKRLVRGLDYYTRTVFEFISTHVGTQGAICGGGRYDNMVKALGGPDTPAVGFAMGVERLLLEAEAQGAEIDKRKSPDIYIASFADTALEALNLCRELIHDGYYAVTDIVERSLKAQMKYADKIHAKYLVVLGSEEIKTGTVKLRNLWEGSEENVAIIDLVNILWGLTK